MQSMHPSQVRMFRSFTVNKKWIYINMVYSQLFIIKHSHKKFISSIPRANMPREVKCHLTPLSHLSKTIL